jgi:hypothetical protein
MFVTPSHAGPLSHRGPPSPRSTIPLEEEDSSDISSGALFDINHPPLPPPHSSRTHANSLQPSFLRALLSAVFVSLACSALFGWRSGLALFALWLLKAYVGRSLLLSVGYAFNPEAPGPDSTAEEMRAWGALGAGRGRRAE